MISLEQLRQLRELVHSVVARMQALEQENAELRQKLEQYEGDLDNLSQENRALEKTQGLVDLEVGELLNELQGMQLGTPETATGRRNAGVGNRALVPEVDPSDSLQFLEKRPNVDPKYVSEMDYETSLQQFKQGSGQQAAPQVSAISTAVAESEQYHSQDENSGMAVAEEVTESQAEIDAEAEVELDPIFIQRAPLSELSDQRHEPQSPEVLPTESEPFQQGEQGTAEAVNSQENNLAADRTDSEESMSHSLDLSLGMDGSSLLELETNFSASSSSTASDDDDELEIF